MDYSEKQCEDAIKSCKSLAAGSQRPSEQDYYRSLEKVWYSRLFDLRNDKGANT
jgi:hypothetical protein